MQNNTMTNLPQGWEKVSFDDIFYNPSSKNYQLNTKDYLDKGCIPIIDQSKKFIIGYSNNYEKVFKINNCNNSCIIFGDHTRVLKFIDFDFIVGADGVKILLNKDIKRFNTKFLFFHLLYKNIPSLGYRRHFSILKQNILNIPPLKEQERIVGILDFAFSKIDENIKKAKENLANIDELMQSALQKAFNPLNDDTKENYQLPQNWEWKSLGNIFNIERGGSPRPIKEFLTDKEDGINWIKIGDIKNQKYLYTTEEKIIQEGLKKSKLVIEGDLLISNSMSFGKPVIVKLQKGAIHDGWLLLREKINLSKEYFYYLFSSNFMYNFLSHQASGSTVKNLNIDKFKQIKIPLPPIKEQEQIASHLDSVFEKTKALKELYTEELKDYEELKQSLLDKAFKGEL